MSVKNRWTITKIGLINFWYYDEQEFEFSDGKLLLRGTNGSGKSVTMQSFIPLLFDGNKSPERLDPFGSRARKLENYILGEDENNKEESTGYLYMEFVKPEIGNYITIGMGLRAKKGRPMDFWGFSITDGRRIGSDIALYKDIGDKIPLSKIELRNHIGQGGEVLEGQRDYMEMVNKHLFGYEDIEEYDELIKLLVQIRTPKLSKEFKPTILYEIMNNSLQPLSDDDLRPLSEAIENMDKIRDQLDMLKNSQKAAERLAVEYNKYNRFILLEKAREFINSSERLESSRKELSNLEKQIEEYKRNHQKAEQEIIELDLQKAALEDRKQKLEQHDGFKAKQEIVKLEEKLKELSKSKELKENALNQKRDREKALNSDISKSRESAELKEVTINELLNLMSELAEDFLFDEHRYVSKEITRDLYNPYDFKLFKENTDKYRTKINSTRKALDEQKNKEKNYDDSLKALEHSKKEREDARKEFEKADTLFNEIKEEFVERVYSWEKHNSLLKIAHEDMPSISRIVNNYGFESTYDDIKTEARKHFVSTENVFNKKLLEHEAIKKTQEDLKKQKQNELDEWKTKKDPDPLRERKVEINRENLKEQGIPFIPFYKAVDFIDDVPQETRGRIEEALFDMGLLDALIVPQKFLGQLPQKNIEHFASALSDAGDRYITPNPQFFKQDLSLLLKPVVPSDKSISFEDIDNALKSILMDDKKSGTYLNENGEYCIGLISGKTTQTYQPKFLGIEARKKYRQEKIDALLAEITLIKQAIEEQDNLISNIRQQLASLNKEFDAFPGRQDLETAFTTLDMSTRILQQRENDIAHKQASADVSYQELRICRDKVRECSYGLTIPLNLEAYEEAENSSNKYKEKISELETLHSQFLSIISRISMQEGQLNEILEDIDSIWEDLRRIKNEYEANDHMRYNLEEVLKQTDYESIKMEVENCINGLKELPARQEASIRSSQQNKEKIESTTKSFNNTNEQLITLEALVSICIDTFNQEYSLGYVVKFEELLTPLAIARKVYSEYKAEEKGIRLRDEYTGALHNKYRENQPYLTEYNLRIDNLFDNEETLNNENTDLREGAMKLLAQRKRHELVAKVQGRDVDFYTMSDFISQAIEENDKLLRESDRQLFEDILANTVGKKIRAKIYHSEQWVKKINALMESMNTSSGLSFSLSWKNKIAVAEDQLDTRDLVELLQTDAVLLTEEDMARLTSHFRSKIGQARKSQEDTGAVQSFHTIMREILDYRKWFEFQLFFKKTGQNRKELTDNAFFKFSGGEKAMAMYVPLFSSVYARFDGARKDCPKVISLDEAFAGVDDNNIGDMFRLVEELKLDYIINSQALWGDYDTVPALSIYELIRPNNADFVATIRYQWNGKIRELIG